MRACLREQKSYGLRFSWFPMHMVCRVVEFSLYSQRAVNTFSKYLLHSAFCYLTVLLLASIVRQGYIYLVRVHRLKPIESSMRLAVA